jgi:macrolide transport system ATP-binding/permease protein
VNGERIIDILLGLRDEGRTIVLVTHDLDLARRADRVAHVRDGRLTHIDDLAPRSAALTRVPTRAAVAGRPSSLRPVDALRDALATIGARIGRTAGLVGAVATAVGLAVASIGISNSASAQVSTRFDLHANRDVTVSAPLTSDGVDATAATDGRGDLRQHARTLLERSRQLAGVDAAAVTYDRGSTTTRATSQRTELQVPATSVVGDIVGAARLTIEWAPNHPKRLGADEILVGRSLADQLPLGTIAAGPVIEVAGADVVVAGVITQSPRIPSYLGGVISAGYATPSFERPSRMSVLLRTASGAAQQVAGQAATALDPVDPDALTIDAPTDPTSLRAEIESDVRWTLLAFTAIALLAAIAALGNAMLLGVLERRAEFGLRRAVGARPVHVAALVLCESAIIGALGGVAGLTGGLGTVLGITVARQWVPVFDLWLAPAAIIGGVVVGCLGGLVAAARATRIEPQEALRG